MSCMVTTRINICMICKRVWGGKKRAFLKPQVRVQWLVCVCNKGANGNEACVLQFSMWCWRPGFSEPSVGGECQHVPVPVSSQRRSVPGCWKPGAEVLSGPAGEFDSQLIYLIFNIKYFMAVT